MPVTAKVESSLVASFTYNLEFKDASLLTNKRPFNDVSFSAIKLSFNVVMPVTAKVESRVVAPLTYNLEFKDASAVTNRFSPT